MLVIPAIDIKDGSCVRLFMGDYNTAHKVADDISTMPLATLVMFVLLMSPIAT